VTVTGAAIKALSDVFVLLALTRFSHGYHFRPQMSSIDSIDSDMKYADCKFIVVQERNTKIPATEKW
jgi:hypothetical protein